MKITHLVLSLIIVASIFSGCSNVDKIFNTIEKSKLAPPWVCAPNLKMARSLFSGIHPTTKMISEATISSALSATTLARPATARLAQYSPKWTRSRSSHQWIVR